MPVRPVAGREHGEDRGRREHIDRDRRAAGACGRRSPRASSAAASRRAPRRRPPPARQTRHRADRRSAAGADAWRGRRSRSACSRRSISAARGRAPRRRRLPAFGERLRVLAPAFEARPVAGRERGRLVEEEQFGVALAPDLAMTVVEIRARQQIHCRDTQRRRVSVRSSRVDAPAAVAHEQAARGIGEQFAERIDAILQRHAATRSESRNKQHVSCLDLGSPSSYSCRAPQSPAAPESCGRAARSARHSRSSRRSPRHKRRDWRACRRAIPAGSSTRFDPLEYVALRRIVEQRSRPGDRVVVVATSVRPAYPMLLQKFAYGRAAATSAPSQSRVLLCRTEPTADRPLYRRYEEAPAEERRFLDELRDDVQRLQPRLIIVNAGAGWIGFAKDFNTFEYLLYSGWAGQALKPYREVPGPQGWKVFERMLSPAAVAAAQ